MDNKDRILKMLEEGKITSEEAIRLMEAIESKEKQDDPVQDTKEDGANRNRSTKNGSKDILNQFMDEFQKYVNQKRPMKH
ncbi:SHOCT-like domain-containing protein [Salinicoccus sp. CNSTN-B1]